MTDTWTHVDTHYDIICLLFTRPLHYHMLPTSLYIYKEALSALQNNRSLPTSALASYQAPYHQVSC